MPKFGADSEELSELGSFLASERGGMHLPAALIGFLMRAVQEKDLGVTVNEIKSWPGGVAAAILNTLKPEDEDLPISWPVAAKEWWANRPAREEPVLGLKDVNGMAKPPSFGFDDDRSKCGDKDGRSQCRERAEQRSVCI